MHYTDKVLGLLGQQEPVQVMERLLPTLRSWLEPLPESLLSRPEGPGKWSILQVVQHLADTEMVYGYRMRLVLTLDRPRFNRFDQQGWAERLGYGQVLLSHSLEQLEALRQANLRVIGRLGTHDLERSGIHSSRGQESLQRMIRLWAGHDLLHLSQIERIQRAAQP